MRRLLCLLCLAFVLFAGTSTAASAVQLSAQECQVMAIWGRDLMWARDMGADREKVKAFVDSQRIESAMFMVLANLFSHLWDSKDDKVETMQALYRDCMVRRGVYGTDT